MSVKIWKPGADQRLYVRMMPNGRVCICDSGGEPVLQGNLFTAKGARSIAVSNEVAARAGIMLDHRRSWDKDQALETLHQMLRMSVWWV